MTEKNEYVAIGAAIVEAMGYRFVRQIGRNVYLEHVATGERSCIGRRDRDEQWLMGGEWTSPEQLHDGSLARN